MKIKKAILAALLCSSVAVSLVGCGSSTTNPTEKTETKTEQKSEQKTNENTSDKDKVDENKKIFVNKPLNITQTSGPFTVKITNVRTLTAKLPENQRALFDNKDQINAVILSVEAEHKGDATDSLYLKQGHLITNTKEQVDANLLVSSNKLGGDFIGNVIKKGDILFVINSNPEELTNLKYVIDPGHNKNYENVTNEFTFDINLK